MPQDPATLRAQAPRWSLAGLSLIHAAVFGWAASVLPWQRWTVFAISTAVLALGHLVTAALAFAGTRLQHHQLRAWRATSLYALAYLALHTFTALSSGVYIAALYGGLGRGVAAGLGAVWCVLVLFTVPLALWGIAVTGGVPRRRGLGLAGALTVAAGLGLWRAAAVAAAEPLPRPPIDAAGFAEQLREAIAAAAIPVPKDRLKTRLWTPEPTTCDTPIDRPTLVVTYPVLAPTKATKPAKGKAKPAAPQLRGVTRCLQADNPVDLLPALTALLADAAAPSR